MRYGVAHEACLALVGHEGLVPLRTQGAVNSAFGPGVDVNSKTVRFVDAHFLGVGEPLTDNP